MIVAPTLPVVRTAIRRFPQAFVSTVLWQTRFKPACGAISASVTSTNLRIAIPGWNHPAFRRVNRLLTYSRFPYRSAGPFRLTGFLLPITQFRFHGGIASILHRRTACLIPRPRNSITTPLVVHEVHRLRLRKRRHLRDAHRFRLQRRHRRRIPLLSVFPRLIPAIDQTLFSAMLCPRRPTSRVAPAFSRTCASCALVAR